MTVTMETRIESFNRDNAINEARLEQLLSEKLMQGYVLLETSCPVCACPLVKNHAMVPRNLSSNSSDFSYDGGQLTKQVIVPQESFEQPFCPVEGVPYCVSCKSHVITQETEVSILEQSASLKDKGSILVALNDMKHFDDEKENNQTKANVPSPPEVIHLEDVEEEKFMASRSSPKNNAEAEKTTTTKDTDRHLSVDIQAVQCDSNDGQSNFEITPSPQFRSNHGGDIDYDDDDNDNNLKPVSAPHIFVDDDDEEPQQQQPSHPEPIFVEDPAYLINQPSKPQSEDNQNEEEESMEYSVRREIATKVLGAKMLQGYTLLEETCDSCAMPLMDYKGEVECVVCPVLERKARKQLKAKKKLEEEKLQLERKVQEKKEIEQKMEEERLENERLEMERIERERLGEGERLESERAELERLEDKRQYQKLELERMEEEEKRELERCLGEERTKKEKKAQHDFDALERLQQIRMTMLEGQSFLNSEEERTQALEEEEHKILQQTRERACVLVEQEEMSRLETIANEEDEMRRVLEVQREKEQSLAAKEGEQKAKQEEEALLLLEETKKIEAFDETTVSDKTEVMKQDLLVEEHRKRLAAKALIDDDVVKLMEAREGEALEFRRQAEKRRIESEERIIAALEADAEVKALTAEAAINRAKVALEDVSTAKKGIIIQAITQGEIETVAETEQLMKAQCEDYKEHIILPSASELTRERWETLRAESRAIMTRRILQGWQLTSQGCVGSECHFSPLVAKKDKTECVVCGGTGNGLDGAYATDDEDEKKDAGNDLPSSKPVADGVAPDTEFVETYNEEEFAIQRELVSQEIGKRMMEGWLLIDASCSTCVMPLMMDYLGNSNICVNKNCSGPAIDQQFDASTIATKDMLALKASVSEHEHDTIEGNIVAAIEKEVAEGVLGNNIIAALEKEVTQKALAAEAAITLARAALEGIKITDDDEGIEMTDDATNAINSAKKVVEVIHLEDVSELRSKREVLEDPTVETEEETQIDTPSRPRSPAVDVGEDFSYIRGQTNMIHDSADVGRNDPPAFTSVPPLNSPPAIDAPASFTNDGPSVSFDIDGEDSKEAINAAITAITTVRKEMEAEKIIAVQEPIHTYRFVNEEPDPSEAKETITLPKNVDFADAGVIRSLVDDNDDNESVAADLSTEMIVNMFLRSEHADDLHDSVETLSLKDVKERIDIYVVTNMGSSVSDDFKYKVAARTLEKLQSSELKSIEMIVNMFLKSPHGYDLHQSENKASLGDVKERVDIFIVTNMDSDVTDEFKFKIAQRIIDKVKYDKVIHLEHLGSPKDPPAYEVSPAATSSYIPQSFYQLAKQSNFSFGEDDVTSKSVTQRRKAPPRPEAMSKRPPMATRSNSFLPPKSPNHSNRFRKGNTIIIGGPSAGPSSPRMRDDDCSAGGTSRCSTVASEALESIYEKIEACKDKLLDPSNNLDEQLATASLLEKLATAAVAVKEMELLED